ncbi:MAG TPA: UvrD-helicase domain-containing protein, partial [Desulfobacterales bacterium]
MSALPKLIMVPAGAGSGKTYRIKEQLADWVVSGAVAPDRIAAVTFTENAAGELRDRIRTELMARDRLDDALRLDRSFITTIHGFGNRLLVEYAFEAGCSPYPRLLEEDEEALLLRKAIARIERIEEISRKLAMFGYTYDFASGKDGAGRFRDRILDCVQMLRVIGGDLDRAARLAHALRCIEQTYGPTEDGPALTASLRRCAQRLLHQYPHCMRDFVNSDSAKAAVEADHRCLQEAAHGSKLNEDWTLWKKLQNLKVFKTNGQLPEDYQQLAREVIDRARRLHAHPGPLADAVQHARVLLES